MSSCDPLQPLLSAASHSGMASPSGGNLRPPVEGHAKSGGGGEVRFRSSRAPILSAPLSAPRAA